MREDDPAEAPGAPAAPAAPEAPPAAAGAPAAEAAPGPMRGADLVERAVEAPAADGAPAPPPSESTLVIACGALAHELVALRDRHGWGAMRIRCLPALLHNRPAKIPGEVRRLLREARAEGWGRVFVAYADCGTGGLLDRVLEEEGGVERLPGAHCYGFYRGHALFDAEHDGDPTCFYITDFIARHFDRLIWQGLGMDRHPSLRDDYFGNYTRAVYLSQQPTEALRAAARAAAERLGLAYEERATGLGPFAEALSDGLARAAAPAKAKETAR